MLKAGIVGLPNVGKSTLFNALTASYQAESANYPFCTIEPNVGVVAVPDARLAQLEAIVNRVGACQKVTPAAFEFVDIAGLVRGASKGEGLGNQFLANIREVDAIVHVVRCFEDANVTHVDGAVDPARDVETIFLELCLADAASLEKRLDKLRKQAKQKDKQAMAECELFTKIQPVIDNGEPVDPATLSPEERILLRQSQLLSVKPVILAANVSESDLRQPQGNPHFCALAAMAGRLGQHIVPISAQIEAELVALPAAERDDYLTSLGVSADGSGVNQLIRAAYDTLGLMTYFTAGVKEVRAWPFEAGMTAPQCAGIIHTDFERGFIRAEVTAFDDYIAVGGEKPAKEKGLTRLEGKDYLMRDGDVVFFRFNV
ncbi:MAG: redox-regulated ATPase YchF [Vampirovibrionales bacterium]|nr:redox-regulated ATPase YchF [Vampirovibrionales bacterium]